MVLIPAPNPEAGFPPTSVYPASPNDAGRQNLDNISRENEASIAHSPEGSEREEKPSLSPYKAVVERPDMVQASHWLGTAC